MLKSVYVKNVLSYFLVTICSLFIAFVITHFFYQNQELQKQESEYIATGNQMIHLYNTLDKKGFKEYLKSTKVFAINIYIYNESGLILSSASEPKMDNIDNKQVQFVLKGGVYRGMSTSHHRSVGLPFTINNQPYALFIKPNVEGAISNLSNILLTVLSIALITGIVLILLTTRILVRPVIKMTAATKELARGKFGTRMAINSKDEFGELAKSFNYMVEELGKTEQMRKDFVANVSHEIQSPLTSIRGMAVALRDEMVDPQEQKHYLMLIEKETERLSHLTKQLLNLSSLESGHYPYQPKSFQLDRQIRRQIVALQMQWLEKEIEMDVELPEIRIVADENLMGQVWSNLLINAIKYNNQKGNLCVRGNMMDQTIEISITNTGPGIPESDLPFIFERFYKVDKAHTRTEKSYGIGLAIVKRIIDLHHGQIRVDSGRGKETTFVVRLPRETPPF